MAIFEIQGPDGRTYEIDAPDQSAALSAFQRVSGSPSAPQSPAAFNDDSFGPSMNRTPDAGAYGPTVERSMGDPLAALSALTRNPEIRNFGDENRNSALGKADSVARGAADMMSLGFADEIAAGGDALFNPVFGTGNEGGSFGERYDRNLNQQRSTDAADSANRFGYRLTGQAAGAIGGGVGMARSGLSLAQNAANAGQGLGRVAGMSAVDGGLLGLTQGFGSGEGGLQDRALNAGKGTLIGAGIGGAAPLAIAGGLAALKPVASPLMARLNPQKYTDLALNATLRRAGTTPERVAKALQSASDDGQDVFSMVDAMGNSGQRMMSTVARTPNDARQEVIGSLMRRQTGQGPRLSNALAEGFGAPDTALQRGSSMTAARDELANANYAAARKDAGPVNLQRVISSIDDTVRPGVQQIVNPADEIAGDSIERALNSYRSRITDGKSVLTDFNRTLSLKKDVSDAVETAKRAGQGNRARVLGMLNAQLDEALETASPAYRAANDTFKTQSRAIDAIETGKNATSGRTRATDNISAFDGLTGNEQAAFRSGYADPWISKVEAASQLPTTNKARLLISDKTRHEFPAFAVPEEAAKLSRRIGREQKMFETLTAATGGSKTADNLADMADMSQFDPSVMQGLLTGGWKQAAVTAAMRGMNEVKGLPPSVVERVGRSLMISNPSEALSVLGSAAKRGQVSAKQRALVTSIINNIGAGSTARLGSP